MSEENQMNEQPEAVSQPDGPRNASNAKAAERIGRKAERRAERKLPTSGSEDDPEYKNQDGEVIDGDTEVPTAESAE